MSDIEKDGERFHRLTGMPPPGESEAVPVVPQTNYSQRELRAELWQLFCKMDATAYQWKALITAKPELPAACEAFIDAYEKSGQLEKTAVAVRLVRDAIAKAKPS